ncbi:unnamed protein product [Nezara viridula]|uniref:Uncharacterized protein n=1 Tax=Nezara viridula TaxID=85310 RepID=A0A9P0HDC2_NEZVI|nr:unnamed protein product [Nezara viridula]
MPVSTNLPLKENSLFKRAMKCYENKQYKNGIKFINQILVNPKYAEHGETLAVKGLLLYCLGKRDDAYDYVKKGLKMELKSYLCWHTYGILHRSDKNYEEAIKCFRNALRWESGNAQILQDLSVLQVQIRDLEGYLDTRAKLFQVAPTQRAAWAGYAVAHHLNRDFETCLKILLTLRKNLNSCYSSYSSNEYSELLLYENLVIEESGDLTGALKHLSEHQDYIRDRVAVFENFSRLHLELKNYKDAETYINQLLARNPERITYYFWLFEALELETDEGKFETLNNLLKTLPRARLPRRMILDYIHGDQFSVEVGIYLQREFRRGVPPLFVDIRPLYKDNKKAKIIETLVIDYKQCLIDNGCLVKEIQQLESPTTLLWIYYFLAQHYCYFKNYDEALSYIDLAICHTPTLPDLYMTKGKIYKKAGNHELASDWLMEARELDSSDRFINSKCAYYHFKANRIKIAEEVTSFFTVDCVNVTESLSEMQCIWYLLEFALAYERLGMYGDALKKCHEIDRHFVQFYQDQFDFHSYCLRGMTLRPYIYLLRFEEDVKDHEFYKKTAQCAIRIYLRLHDAPKKIDTSESTNETNSLTSSELRKLKNKERKAKKRAELAKICDEKYETKSKSKVEDICDAYNEYFNADFFQNTPTPLEEALRFLLPLKAFSPHDITTHLAAFEIYYRKGKSLLMLQAIKRGYSIDPDHPLFHEMIVRFTLLVHKAKSEGILKFPLSEVVDRQMEPIWKGRTPKEINDDFLKRHQFSLPGLVQAARCLYLIDNSKQSEAYELCTSLDDSIQDVNVEECSRVANYMKYGLLGHIKKEEIDSYLKKCHEKFPLASVFMPPEESQTNIFN